MTRPGTGGSDGDRPTRERVAADQGDLDRRDPDRGDVVARGGGPGGGRLGPNVRRRRGGRRGDDGSREQAMVPKAEFRSYYGRQILKTPAWEDKIAYYFFAGGLSGGCALLGAGAGETFDVERYSAEGWAYGMAYGHVNQHGWVQNGWFC